MKIFVTAYEPHIECLSNFNALINRYLNECVVVDVAPPDEKKSDQLIRFLGRVVDEYVILLEADFYLIDYVSSSLLQQVLNFCVKEKVDRFSLQSKNVYLVSDWKDTAHTVGGKSVFQAHDKVRSQFGLDASIWKKSFLLSHLKKGQSDGTIETTIYHKICNKDYKIYALDELIMSYRDAIRRGKFIIDLQHDPLKLVCTPGTEKSLHPTGETSRELLLP